MIAEPRCRALFTAVVTIFCAAFLCSQISWRLRPERMDEMIAQERAVLRGEAEHPEFQNRVLAPTLLELIERASGGRIESRQAWKIARLLSALFAFAAVYIGIFRLTDDRSRAMAACAWTAYGYLWTPMSFAWEHSSDFFDIGFMALMATAAVRGHAIVLVVLTLIAAFNRESAAFGGLVLCGQVWFRRDLPRRHFAWGVGCVVAAFVTVTAIRYAMRGSPSSEQMLGIMHTLEHWRLFMHPLGTGGLVVAMFLPIGAALWSLPRPWSFEQRGLLAAAGAIAVITCVFGILYELRVLLPVYVLLVFTWALSSQAGGVLKSASEERR